MSHLEWDLGKVIFKCLLQSRNKAKVSQLPFVLGAPFSEEQGTMLVVGIPPVADTVKKK